MKPRKTNNTWTQAALGVGIFLVAGHLNAGVPGAIPGAGLGGIPGIPTVSTNATTIPGAVPTPLPGVPGGGVMAIPPGFPGGAGTLPPPSIATNAIPMNPGAGGGSTVGGVPGAGAGPIPGSGPIPGINPPTLNPGTGFPTNSVPGTGAFPFPFPGTFPPGPTTNAPPVMTQEEINREYNRRLREAMEIFKREAKLIRRQAREGNARQQHNLAVLYTLGLGVPLDFKRAHHWFNRAAQQGLSESQFNLGIAYQGGMGVQKDFVTSYKYYTLAAAKGLPFAGQWRDHLAQYMNRIQIEAGQRMARGFLQGIERWEINKANEEHDRLRQNRILGIESRP